VHARVAITVRDVDITVGRDADVRRLVERRASVSDAVDDRDTAAGDVRVVHGLTDFLGIPGVRSLVARADAQQVLALLVELRNQVRDRLDEVGVVVGGDADAVRVLKHLLAPVVDELAGFVEDHERVLGAGEDVDVVLGVAGDAGALAPAPALWELTPALNQLVLTLSHIDVPGVDCHVSFLPLFERWPPPLRRRKGGC
jgi:hypothetical protein